MKLKKAERQQVTIKMAIQGASGSGKTYSALLLAFGLTKHWSSIAVIDAENGSSHLYAHLGDYQVLRLNPPFSPERYIQALEVCEKSGMKCIILDGISPCWDYLLEYHSSLTGNSFTNWGKITPRHKAFIQRMLTTEAHLIATMRTKQEYVLNQKDGKYVPEKMGTKAIQRDGVDYEFTIVFDLDQNHLAKASKDRTSIFSGKPEFLVTPETGSQILKWCSQGISIEDLRKRIQKAADLQQLKDLYQAYPELFDQLEKDFINRKKQLTAFSTNPSKNGSSNHQ